MNGPPNRSKTYVRYWTCDVCGKPVHEPGRWRHEDCPVPVLPPSAREVIARMKNRRT